ncbi:hypothetical protein GPECTOR_50g610 [Gonium pectorale]|uniref:Uncharacterized protein n=1 Tax=Gonium pectorale TaxID=33097 RepID=A0A150G7H5_GONPE|nr:hypothetical protein GPECTOR_50g610 [Gonium pectorale]|eukprot:KXZ45816.1 hypothetical protein GPECTOR_50g610 [Gonium pectorale]
MNSPHVAQLIAGRSCFPVGGGPHAALQELPLQPAAFRADATIAAFPCSGSYAAQLLYVLRSGAVIDPWVRLRCHDHGNLAHMAGLLLLITLALAAPRVYERCRHDVMFVHGAWVLLGWYASALWAPPALVPLIGAAYIGGVRRRSGAVYMGWQAMTTHRVS